MQEIKVEELTPHPKNEYFFDDMVGQKWKEFIESIKTSGVIEPIVITQNKIIVSGHQRVRACKELGIDKVMADIRIYEDEDKIIKDLLETNIRQRGDVSSSSLKMGRIICELERIYGVKNGGDRKSEDQNDPLITQKHLAETMGISHLEYKRYKRLQQLIPEIQSMVDDKIPKSVASGIIARLSPAEQEELLKSLPTTEKLTQKQVQEYIDKLKEKDNQIAGYEMKLQKVLELENQINNLVQELENRPTVEKVKEVTPIDYEDTKHKLRNSQEDYNFLKKDYDNKVKQLNDLKAQLKTQKEQEPQEQFDEKLKNSVLIFCAKTAKFIEEVGGYAWLTDYFNQIPNTEKQGYIKSINALDSWINTMKNNM